MDHLNRVLFVTSRTCSFCRFFRFHKYLNLNDVSFGHNCYHLSAKSICGLDSRNSTVQHLVKTKLGTHKPTTTRALTSDNWP
jgi:hypothetical protein